MREPENIRAVLKSKPEWLGFIFYKQSPRFVNAVPPEIDFGSTKKAGVFVNEELQTVKTICELNQLDIVQLHGNETPEYCELLSKEVQVIKAFSVQTEKDLQLISAYEGKVNYFLFDTKSHYAKGGTGKKFNWNLLHQTDIKKPFLLSGGISVNDIELLQNFHHKSLIGYDINSKFERKEGVKNVAQVAKFIQKVKSYELRS